MRVEFNEKLKNNIKTGKDKLGVTEQFKKMLALNLGKHFFDARDIKEVTYRDGKATWKGSFDSNGTEIEVGNEIKITFPDGTKQIENI